MAIIVRQVLPAGVGLDMIDAVTDEMGVETTPPAGMLVHTHFEQDGRVHVVDIWDSSEAHEAFAATRLMPAMGKVSAARGVDLAAAGPPETVVTEVHRLVRGA
jgi:hypothetical protein